MADLLLELFSEEIPARMQRDALGYLVDKLKHALESGPHCLRAGFAISAPLQGFVTPRRLAVIIQGLPVEQLASETELKGPKVGAPEAALQGFLKKTGLQQSDLTERDGVYLAVVKKEGRKTADILKIIIEETLAAFPWPKSMRWGSGETSWVRPLHSILCIFNGEIVNVSFAGITAGNTTRGHRFLSPDVITISDPAEYEPALEKACVIADRDKRKASILKQAETIAAAQGLQLKKDEGLLEEVTGLVEYPVVLAGRIDAKYMDLPKEVLVSEMRAHQKYFALENKDGSLSDVFLITANMKTTDGGKAVIAGNERVLRARLSDGRFFWDQDRKKTLGEWAEGLKTVTYHAKLGTIADKVTSMTKLALQLADDYNLARSHAGLTQRAAELCKADLVTGMVGEFPELQGIMGGYYAHSQGEKKEVANAIRDHYKPQGPTDSVPTEPASYCLALADKLDTIKGMFSIGEKPTGSKDPFALRRAALGVIRIILENKLRLKLKYVVSAEIFGFFIDRLKVQLKDSGIRHDVIEAVVANGDDDLVRIVERAKAVQAFIGTDDGMNLLAGYKRAANILAIEEKKDGITYHATFTLHKISGSGETVFQISQDEENLLHDLEKIHPAVQDHLKAEQYVEALKITSEIRKSVDAFFDKVRINDERAEVRIARLKMLSSLRLLFDEIADFSKIEGDVKEQKKAA